MDITKWKIFLHTGSICSPYMVKTLQKPKFEDIANHVKRFLKEMKDVAEFIEEIKLASENCFHYNKDVILIALATCATSKIKDLAAQAYDRAAVLCKESEDILQFVIYCEQLSEELDNCTGWGRKRRKIIQRWYTDKCPAHIAFLVTECPTFKHWSHKDLLKLCHLNPSSSPLGIQIVCTYIARGYQNTQLTFEKEILNLEDDDEVKEVMSLLGDYKNVFHVENKIRESITAEQVAKIVHKHKFTWNHIPSCWYNNETLWKRLLFYLPLKHLLKNIPRLVDIKVLQRENLWAKSIAERLMDKSEIEKSGLHPMEFYWYRALYASGYSHKKRTKWYPEEEILSAFDEAFYTSIKFVEPIKKSIEIIVDFENSNFLANSKAHECIPIAAAYCYVLKHCTEPPCNVRAKKQDDISLDDTDTFHSMENKLNQTKKRDNIGADCASSLIHFKKNNIKADIILYITNAKKKKAKSKKNKTTPNVALNQYKQNDNPDTRFVLLSLHTEITVNEKESSDMLEICGFDYNVPDLIANFASKKF